MIPSRLKDLKNLSSLPPTRQLKYYKVIFFISVGLMVLMSFFSLGVTGMILVYARVQFYDMERHADWGYEECYER